MASVIIDAGHGGSDRGASYQGRLEKDDTLRLALAVGRILSENGVNVSYTRTEDVYDTPYEKAVMGNNSGADFFISIHRNSVENPNTASGIMTLVYNDQGMKAELARNINEELSKVGYRDLGVVERPNLVVLRRTRMPAVLVEVGFINNDEDNALFDQRFDQIAQGIADGILETLRQTGMQEYDAGSGEYEMMREQNMGKQGAVQAYMPLYRVQTGAFRNYQNATRFLRQLEQEGYPAFILHQDGYYRVQAGAYRYLENAMKMEQKLKRQGYNTFITTS